MAKVYNTTDLRPDQAFERHVFHRDQFAHYLRWTHILKEAKIGESIVDFGCGAANLLEVLYRNKFKQKEYIGIDIREKTIQQAAEKYADNETITALAATVAEQWAAYQANPTGYFDSVELMELDTMIGGKGINDPALVETLCSNSADAIDWLDEHGITLHSVSSFGGASVKRLHRPVDAEGKTLSVGSYMIPLLQELSLIHI